MEPVHDKLKNILNETHQAIAIETHSPEHLLTTIQDLFPDEVLFARYYEYLGIQDLEDAKVFFRERVGEGDSRRFILVAFQDIGVESQNALLKEIEELREPTRVIFIYPQGKELLSTVRSRLLIHRLGGEIENREEESGLFDIPSFIQLPLQEKFSLIQTFIAEEKKKTEDERRLKSRARHFLTLLEQKLAEEHNKKREAEFYPLLSSILKTKEYLDVRGASVKQLLESLAIEIHFSPLRTRK